MEKRLDRCSDALERENELSAMKQLISPDGMGKVFKVLIQHKEMPRPDLKGLSFRPFAQDAISL